MKIKVLSLTEEAIEERDYRDVFAIEIDDKRQFKVQDGEPEDGNLGRDFNDCFKIPELMRMAYEAGKNGEKFEIVNEEVEEI